ncbi:DUF485 domain-containing protein [Tessaracoccus sp. SD287]|uniref:DUF485 domain-containing protein n=1 Tax=Tessaracoccus sp. SD287 TaxID=2782008 RepID=UPI001A966805|nr:DUF485 domain-containing protein [Tessaracoccus sp. SD287]
MTHAQALPSHPTPTTVADITDECPRREATPADFIAVADSLEYKSLRSTFVTFAFSMTIAALIAYFSYVIASVYAVDFMRQPFLGLRGTNLGIVLGLAQFAIVWVWTSIYVRFTDKKIDPRSDALKATLEGGAA